MNQTNNVKNASRWLGLLKVEGPRELGLDPGVSFSHKSHPLRILPYYEIFVYLVKRIQNCDFQVKFVWCTFATYYQRPVEHLQPIIGNYLKFPSPDGPCCWSSRTPLGSVQGFLSPGPSSSFQGCCHQQEYFYTRWELRSRVVVTNKNIYTRWEYLQEFPTRISRHQMGNTFQVTARAPSSDQRGIFHLTTIRLPS